MTILGCYIVWNEEDFLALSMRSIQSLVDGYVVVDGNLLGFARDKPLLSTDRTVEIARRFPSVKVIELEEPLPECEKRELCFKEPADWYVIMDADNIMLGDVERLKRLLNYKEGLTSIDIPTYNSLDDFMRGNPICRCVAFHRDSGFHYGEHHHIQLDKDGTLITGKGFKADFIRVLCLRELRTEERVKQKTEYAFWKSSNQGVRW